MLVFESHAKAGTVCECESNDDISLVVGGKKRTVLKNSVLSQSKNEQQTSCLDTM